MTYQDFLDYKRESREYEYSCKKFLCEVTEDVTIDFNSDYLHIKRDDDNDIEHFLINLTNGEAMVTSEYDNYVDIIEDEEIKKKAQALKEAVIEDEPLRNITYKWHNVQNQFWVTYHGVHDIMALAMNEGPECYERIDPWDHLKYCNIEPPHFW